MSRKTFYKQGGFVVHLKTILQVLLEPYQITDDINSLKGDFSFVGTNKTLNQNLKSKNVGFIAAPIYVQLYRKNIVTYRTKKTIIIQESP